MRVCCPSSSLSSSRISPTRRAATRASCTLVCIFTRRKRGPVKYPRRELKVSRVPRLKLPLIIELHPSQKTRIPLTPSINPLIRDCEIPKPFNFQPVATAFIRLFSYSCSTKPSAFRAFTVAAPFRLSYRYDCTSAFSDIDLL